jgi:hypothetical protein
MEQSDSSEVAGAQASTDSNVVAKFRNLPDARTVPDTVWTVQGILDRLLALEVERQQLQHELLEASTAMEQMLLRDWSRSEIRAAGLMT